MSCPIPIDPACITRSVSGHAAGFLTDSVIGGIAHAVQSGVAWVVSATVDWWVQVPSLNPAAEPSVGALQRWLLPVTVAVAVGSMLVAGGKMAITRKANPLVDVGTGLALLIATSALGVALPAVLMRAGDLWSSWVLTQSTGGHFGSRLTAVLVLQSAAPAPVIVLGVVAIVMTAVQAVLMIFRQAAIIILAGVLPLATAGALAPATRGWFKRTTGWMLALIFYKPAAAAVYATTFTIIGRSSDPRVVFTGFAMVFLSLLALPVLMKLFTWTTGSIETSANGGLLGTVLSGAVAVGAVRGYGGPAGGGSASDQARLVAGQLGPPGGQGPQGMSGQGGRARAAADSGPPGAARQQSPSAFGATGRAAPQGASPTGPTGPVSPVSSASPTPMPAGGAVSGAGGAAAAGGPAGAAVGAAAQGAAAVARTAAGSMQPPGSEG